jgi:ABC-type amino acid transport substrate-binding protein
VDALRRREDLRIGFAELSRGFVARVREVLPNAELVELGKNREYFEMAYQELDALLISAESGSAYTLLFPEYQVVVPAGANVKLPLFYALGARDEKFLEFLNYWLAMRKRDGTTQEYYEHWILGKSIDPAARRWCVIRDVLHWVD